MQYPPPTFTETIATLITLFTLCWRERDAARRRQIESDITGTITTLFELIDRNHTC